MSQNNPLKYSGRTSHFNIPVFRPDSQGNDVGAGTPTAPRPSARAEQRAMNIEDEQMYGVRRSLLGNQFQSCVLNEGTFTLSGNVVVLSSIEAFINGIFVNNRGNPITWTINLGTETDLYIALTETGPNVQSTAFQSSREYGQLKTAFLPTPSTAPDNLHIIVGRVAADGVITVNPPGKKYFAYPFDHFTDFEDPHGQTLTQTNVTVLGLYSGDELLEAVNLEYSGVASCEDMVFDNINAQVGNFDGLTDFSASTTNVGLLSGLRMLVSGITTFGGNVSLQSGVTVDGQDPSVRGPQLDVHIANLNNPHNLTLSQIYSGLSKYGDVLLGNLDVSSGVAIDGIDFSTLVRFLDGSLIPNSDHFHQYPRKTTSVKKFLIPEFEGVTFSGVGVTQFLSDADSLHNYYTFSGTAVAPICHLFARAQMDDDLSALNSIKVYHKGSDGVNPYVSLSIYDSNGNECPQTGGKNLKANSWTQATVTPTGGSFRSGTDITLKITLGTPSGSEVKVGELMLDFDRSKASTI